MTPIHTLPTDIQSLIYCLFACVFGQLMLIGLWHARYDEVVAQLQKLKGRQ